MTIRYRNPHLPEVNASADSGRGLLALLGSVAAILVTVMALLLLAIDHLVVKLPFSAERALADTVAANRSRTKPLPPADRAVETALQNLAVRVAKAMELPSDMTLTVHYVDSPTVNAMATLGGHIFVFRGLLGRLGSEDAVAAVLAHEAGHVRRRHVVRAMGRGVALVTALGLLGIKSQGLNQWALGKGSEMAALSYSREAEREADQEAQDVVYRLYGHGGGIREVFALFARLEPGGAEVLRSHPLAANRLDDLNERAHRLGYGAPGELRPLPEPLAGLRVGTGNGPAAVRGTRPD